MWEAIDCRRSRSRSGAEPYRSSRPRRHQESARIPDRISQHGVKLALGEFLGRRRDRLCLDTLGVDTTLSTGRAQAAAGAGLRVGTATILGLAVGGL